MKIRYEAIKPRETESIRQKRVAHVTTLHQVIYIKILKLVIILCLFVRKPVCIPILMQNLMINISKHYTGTCSSERSQGVQANNNENYSSTIRALWKETHGFSPQRPSNADSVPMPLHHHEWMEIRAFHYQDMATRPYSQQSYMYLTTKHSTLYHKSI